MKRFLKIVGILAGIAILTVIIIAALLQWMDRWGATSDEIAASYSADGLVPFPAVTYTRAIFVNALPEEIYP